MNINWWQATLIALVVFAVGFGTRHLTYKCPPIPMKDTIYVPAFSGMGKDSSEIKPARRIVFKAPSSPVVARSEETPTETRGTEYPSADGTSGIEYNIYEKETKDSTNSVYFSFKSTTYVAGDTAFVVHEYNIVPKPYKIVIPDHLEYVKEVPFLEKPEVAYPLGIAIGITLVWIASKIVK